MVSLDTKRFNRERLHAPSMVPTVHPWALSVFAQSRNNAEGAKEIPPVLGMGILD
jgi:hypothetical protein